MRRLLLLIIVLSIVSPTACWAIPVRWSAGVPLPDFERITFANLPPIAEGGSIQIADPAIIAALGYDPSRLWQSGARADATILLGDMATAFGPEQLSLEQIAALGLTQSLQLSQLRLSDLKLLAINTVADIVQALAYENLPPEAVPLLRDLAVYFFKGGTPPYERLIDLIQYVPGFGELPLGTLDLARYALSGLPGIEQVAIDRLAGWAGQFIRDIPGLADIPFARFARFPRRFSGIAGLVDIPLAAIEQERIRTITGSDIEGFAVPCHRDCLHVELGNPLSGKQWIGKTQLVRGGHGPLAAVNTGKEPTGRLPFGPWGKIVLTAVNEKAGTADFGLYLRVCIKTAFIDLGCTPYFIGPIPWIPSQEKALTFVGPN
ncbi:hypothetical protein [Gloeobacter kilaueensis]|uniref:Uncharacterized protein n=1 Tax=Gloeobacter kilaueensis (strain ATCC BAA-2537 / CCAP 1431/1 / ULC 316 / JS1) TaxID=1183438 RepID=U5QHZ7_GLOK1|nr:hypothetical protein [Gloeobacter kilaueensis]AGY57249.1 hypothetical protein GKIL_1003 [Gloeobacter kilaueensis JS1]